jgi:hypothetical protein
MSGTHWHLPLEYLSPFVSELLPSYLHRCMYWITILHVKPP